MAMLREIRLARKQKYTKEGIEAQNPKAKVRHITTQTKQKKTSKV